MSFKQRKANGLFPHLNPMNFLRKDSSLHRILILGTSSYCPPEYGMFVTTVQIAELQFVRTAVFLLTAVAYSEMQYVSVSG